jgi:hypothetical protein
MLVVYSAQVVVPGPGGATMQRDFSFHACLGPEVNQADVMELCGIHQLLDAALAGYHVTIFAYGQTGTTIVCTPATWIHTCTGSRRRSSFIQPDTSSNACRAVGSWHHDGQQLAGQTNTIRDAC